MISFIRGPIAAIDDDVLVIDKSGIGMAVSVPLNMLGVQPVVGNEIMLHTYLQIREDAWVLFGFSTPEQKQMFIMLLNVSGVGTRTALAIVDKLSVAHFAAIIASQDTKPLLAVSGVGKKTAERILLELKDKFIVSSSIVSEDNVLLPDSDLQNDLVAALRNLGYTATEARSFAIKAQQDCGPAADAEKLLREALKIAMKS